MGTIIETNELDPNYIDINVNVIDSAELMTIHDFDEEVVDDMEDSDLPINVNSCLILNRAYSESIDDLKQYLHNKRRENESRRQELQTNTNYKPVKDITITNCGYTHPNSLITFMAPYFKDMKGLSAPSNEDVIDKKRNGEINEAFLSSGKPWNVNEKERLKQILEDYAMESLQKPLRDQKERLTQNKKSLTQETVVKIQELTEKIDKLGEQLMNDIPVPQRGDQSLDWLKFATILDTDHTADDCEIYWDNFLHPSVNKSEWTKEEDNCLECLVKKYGMNDWDQISRQLGTGRLAWQCCSRYQMEFNKELKRVGPLTKAEAKTVEKVIESCRVGDYIPWHQVSYFIEGRTLPQIKHYWNKINVPKRGDVWIDEENKVLSAAVKKYGTHNWRKVAHFLPGRSNRQCRERYMMRMNVTDRKLGNWTPNEDKQILKLAPEYDYHWVKLEEHIKGRNARQIASRYDLLVKHQSNAKIGKQNKNKFGPNSRFSTRTLTVRTRLCERIRQIINRNKAKSEDLDQILRTGRAKLAKMLELESRGINLATKGRPKKSLTEENIDSKICEMFALYDHKTTPKKSLARGVQDQCVYDTTKHIINEMLTGSKFDSQSDLAKAIRLIISNKITSNGEQSISSNESQNSDEDCDLASPPIFPPNRTTVMALRSMLIQTDHLSRKIAKSKIGLEECSSAVAEDEDYKKLSAQFKSLFCWPALLSLINVPERGPQPEAVNTTNVVKPKRRSWLETDSSRMIQIRTKQTKLIQTAMQSKEETTVEEELDEVVMKENSAKAPWYVTHKQRKYYNLKSLDKSSFVFTRVKPRHDLIPELDESQTSDKRKRKLTDDSNNLTIKTGDSCDETVIKKRSKNKNNRVKEKGNNSRNSRLIANSGATNANHL